MQQSRTKKSIKNVQVAMIFYIINLILQFFSRKIFLDYLGSEILGLNTTVQNLLGFLSIAELGIGVAVASNLYKPIHDHDKQAINDIVSIQGWLYRRIAYIIMAGALILMCFFPKIFAKAEVPLWYAYGSFAALLISSLLGYFVNYKQIVLSADQKEYKITYCVQGVKVSKIILQILAIRFLNDGYLYWLIIEALMAALTSFVLSATVKKEYSWLNTTISKGKELQKSYPNVIKRTKQAFFHRIGSLVLYQTTPLVIYAYVSLSLVAIYGNYLLIFTGLTSLMSSLLNGITAGVGNLVAEGDSNKSVGIFWELTAVRMWLAVTMILTFYFMGDSFITLWVGKEYILPESAFIFMLLTLFIQLTRTHDAFRSAFGLYQDIWAPIIEAGLNLGLSIIFGKYWGLTGILAGVFISQVIIMRIWAPFFLFKNGFHIPFIKYIAKYCNYIIILLCAVTVVMFIVNKAITTEACSYLQWLWKSILIVLLSATISFIIFSTDKYFRRFPVRIYNSIKN